MLIEALPNQTRNVHTYQRSAGRDTSAHMADNKFSHAQCTQAKCRF